MVGRVVLVDDRGVLDQRLELLDPALDERLLVLGVLVLGVLGDVAVLLGVVDPRGNFGAAHVGHLLELAAGRLETFAGEVSGPVVHAATLRALGLLDGEPFVGDGGRRPA